MFHLQQPGLRHYQTDMSRAVGREKQDCHCGGLEGMPTCLTARRGLSEHVLGSWYHAPSKETQFRVGHPMHHFMTTQCIHREFTLRTIKRKASKCTFGAYPVPYHSTEVPRSQSEASEEVDAALWHPDSFVWFCLFWSLDRKIFSALLLRLLKFQILYEDVPVRLAYSLR
jgi:hypothetical protein